MLLGDEQCEDGNDSDNDGCDSSCMIETGYYLVEHTDLGNDLVKTVLETRCGDGFMVGTESCDDGVKDDE